MNTPNETIHQTTRLKIMSALSALPRREALEFVRLRAITGATDGNLGAHLATLEKAGYIKVVKDFEDKKPRTSVLITAAGKQAFMLHANYLQDVIEASGASNT